MSGLAIYLLVAAGVALGVSFGIVVEDENDRTNMTNILVCALLFAVLWPLTAVLLVIALFERQR